MSTGMKKSSLIPVAGDDRCHLEEPLSRRAAAGAAVREGRAPWTGAQRVQRPAVGVAGQGGARTRVVRDELGRADLCRAQRATLRAEPLGSWDTFFLFLCFVVY